MLYCTLVLRPISRKRRGMCPFCDSVLYRVLHQGKYSKTTITPLRSLITTSSFVSRLSCSLTPSLSFYISVSHAVRAFEHYGLTYWDTLRFEIETRMYQRDTQARLKMDSSNVTTSTLHNVTPAETGFSQSTAKRACMYKYLPFPLSTFPYNDHD